MGTDESIISAAQRLGNTRRPGCHRVAFIYAHISQEQRRHGRDDVHESPTKSTSCKTTPKIPSKELAAGELELPEERQHSSWMLEGQADEIVCGRALTASANAAMRRIEGRILEIVREKV